MKFLTGDLQVNFSHWWLTYLRDHSGYGLGQWEKALRNNASSFSLAELIPRMILESLCEIALRWMSLDLIDNKSTLNQVMAWCHKATSHYLIQCWLTSMSPYGVTRPQWIDELQPSDAIWHSGPWSIENWFRIWLVAWQHQTITWTNDDLLSVKRKLYHCSLPEPLTTLLVRSQSNCWLRPQISYPH